MLLTTERVELLKRKLKMNCPFETGALLFSIEMFQESPEQWKLIIGMPSSEGRDPSRYALYTEVRNKTSKGWIERTLKEWIIETRAYMAFKVRILEYKMSYGQEEDI